jgi:hypothetical protein
MGYNEIENTEIKDELGASQESNADGDITDNRRLNDMIKQALLGKEGKEE